jgi:hypothetical protein
MSPAAGLHRLLFTPVDARSLGLMRILLGLLLIANHVELWAELHPMLGRAGWAPLAAAQAEPHRASPYDVVPDGPALHLVHGAGLLVLVAFTLGWRTRWVAWAALAVQVAIHHRNPWMQHGGDRVLRLATLALCLVPAGAALSLDARAGRGAPTVPALAHRMVQLQWMIIYGATGAEKMLGRTWRDGSALLLALGNGDFQRFPHRLDPLLALPAVRALAAGATWATLAWELAFPLLVLHPRTRRPALLAGLVVHGGIWLTMRVGAFTPAILWGYLAFLPAGALGAWAAARSPAWLRPPAAGYAPAPPEVPR